MIPLRLKIDPLPLSEPIVVRLNTGGRVNANDFTCQDVHLIDSVRGGAEFDLHGFSLRVHNIEPHELDGDVVMLTPGRPTLHRLIRAGSRHNTLLITEQCDQKCIMCSQPPKEYHVDLFQAFLEAVCLAPEGSVIGVSGGEPTLHMARLREFLLKSLDVRRDVGFHVLTNGQHFQGSDLTWLSDLDHGRVTWGVPIYSADPSVHDRVVGKIGAFAQLERGLAVLAKAGCTIELRTVPMISNALGLPALARYLSTRLPFAAVWAIMQLENIGYARQNWTREFFDSSTEFGPVAEAINLAEGRGLPVMLYNFPLCTVPVEYRAYATQSISDWKQRYLTSCEGCSAQGNCCGFFEWYPEARGFKEVVRL